MTKNNIKLIFAFALAMQPALGWATEQLFVPPPMPAPAPAQNPGQGIKGGPGSTINQGANTGQASQNAGAGANNAAGAALIAAGIPMLAQPPTVPIGVMLIAMGAMALAQGAHDSGAAGQSAATGAASVHNGGPGTQANQATDPDLGKSSFNTPEIKKAQAELAKHGYEVNEKGVTKPDGSIIPASAFQSKEGMLAAGIDPAVLAKLDEVNKDVASAYNVSSVATGGGGGGSGAIPEDVGGGGSETALGSRDPFDLNDDARRSMMAGKTVNLDGEPIGVAGANIFDMVHTAYQKKRAGAQFLEGEEPMLRAPASTSRKFK
jgi:hypothetical protein